MMTAAIDQDDVIAEYALGLSSPEVSGQIQARLSHDDAAAACALKWETYLLGISDSLKPVPPPPELLAQVQKALGHETIAPSPPASPVPAPAPASVPEPAITAIHAALSTSAAPPADAASRPAGQTA